LLAARLSLPFNVALVLVHGDVLAADLEEREMGDQRIRALLPKIRLIADQDMRRRGARLNLRFKDGRTEAEAIEVPRGSAANPLVWEDIVEKFKPLVRPLIAENHQLNIIEAVANVEAADGAAFMDVLRAAVESMAQTH